MRTFTINDDLYIVEAPINDVKEVPVPNSEEAIDWWYNQMTKDSDAVFNILLRLEKIGIAWVGSLAHRLINDMN